MNPDYRVTSDGLVVPQLANVLETLVEIANRLDTGFFVIGALARDILLTKIHGISGLRATGDIDVAIAFDAWEKFYSMTAILRDELSYRQTRHPHRLVSPDGAVVDIVPFGEIEDPAGTIEWPDEDGVSFSTVGLKEASKAAITVTMDARVTFRVASLPAIVWLKLIAWSENRSLRPNDPRDICNLMRRYIDVLGDGFYTVHSDILDARDFDYDTGSARALGRDVGLLLRDSPGVANEVLRIVQEQTSEPEQSQLALDMGNECNLDYQSRFACLVGFRRGLTESLEE